MQVLSAPLGDGDAGLRDCEPLLRSFEGQVASMYERIADYIDEIHTSLRIYLPDAVYSSRMDELRSLRDGQFDRVSQSPEKIRVLLDRLHLQLVLVENSGLENPATYGEGRPERPTSSRRPDYLHPSTELGGAARCIRVPGHGVGFYAAACP